MFASPSSNRRGRVEGGRGVCSKVSRFSSRLEIREQGVGKT